MTSYFNQAIPDPYRILGLTLKPLSIGRYRLLKRFDCAFVSEEQRIAKIEDLIIGVLICSMSCEQFLKLAESKEFFTTIKRWGRKVCGPEWLLKLSFLCKPFGRWWRKRNGFNVFEKIRLFKSYIKQSSEMPRYWDTSQNSEQSPAHWCHGLEVILRSELNWSKEEIDEEPLSKALVDYLKYAENKGAIQFMSEWEIAEIDRQNKEAN